MANYLLAIKCKFLILGLDVACFNDHTFPVSNNDDLQNIQRHGTWASDCV